VLEGRKGPEKDYVNLSDLVKIQQKFKLKRKVDQLLDFAWHAKLENLETHVEHALSMSPHVFFITNNTSFFKSGNSFGFFNSHPSATFSKANVTYCEKV
jgi:hypothetical protein